MKRGRTRPARFHAASARAGWHNDGRDIIRTNPMEDKARWRAGKIEGAAVDRRHFAGDGSFTAVPVGQSNRIAGSLQCAVPKQLRRRPDNGRRRQRRYQQQKTGERSAEKAKSPTNRSMLLPWCRQTPCLSISPPKLNIPSLGQYVGGISTVHPEAGKFCEITPICRNRETIFSS